MADTKNKTIVAFYNSPYPCGTPCILCIPPDITTYNIYWCGLRFAPSKWMQKNPLYKTWAQPQRNQDDKKKLKNLIKIFCQNIDFCAAYRTCDSFENKNTESWFNSFEKSSKMTKIWHKMKKIQYKFEFF